MTLLPTSLLLLIATNSAAAIYAEAEIPGATLKITVQQPIDAHKARELITWVQSAAKNVEAVYGRFPGPTVTIIITPVTERFWRENDAVQFGRVTRNNGGTVQLYVNPKRPIAEFNDDWTATHEFSHLMLPLLNKPDRWISEGIATYYQNILLARSGTYTQKRAWTRLLEGFDRGRKSAPTLSPTEAAANRNRGATMKVYWSGAALALMADITLRQRSNGEESLDTVLGEMQSCCLPSRNKWSGKALFEQLDRIASTPVFMPLYRRYANSTDFPDVSPLLEELGVDMNDGSVSFSDTATLADLRNTLTNVAVAR